MAWSWTQLQGNKWLGFSIFIAGLAVAIGGAVLYVRSFQQKQKKPRQAVQTPVERWLTQQGHKKTVLKRPVVDGYSFEYVVISASGVYVIRTDNSYGRVRVSEDQLLQNNRKYAGNRDRSVQQDCDWLENWLKRHGHVVKVQPLLVFTEASTEIQQFRSIAVLPLRWLEMYICRGGYRLELEDCRKIAGLLKSWTIKANGK